MNRRSIWIGVAAIAVITCAAGWWFYTAYYRAGVITLSDGAVVRDFSVAEVGEFALPRDDSLRRQHLERRHNVRGKDVLEIGDPSVEAVSHALAPVLDEALAANAGAGQGLSRAGPEARQELVRMVARVTAAMAGLDREQYVGSLHEELMLAKPAAIGAVELTADEFSDGFRIPDDGAPPSAWEEPFADVYNSTRGYRDGEFLLKRIVTDPANLLIAIAPHEHGRRTSLVEAQYGKEVFDRVLRASAQAQPVFYQATPHNVPGDSGGDHQHGDGAEPTLLDASIVFFMEDGSGDRYPVSITATYDASRPEGARWTLLYVSRLSSPRVFVAPFFAF